MKAIVNNKYGGPEVMALKEVDKPVPEDNEVLVKVRAASVNDWDYAILTGVPKIYRLMSGIFKPKFTILGSDIAGVVESVGEGTSKFKVGDEVYGDLSERWGGFAQYVCAPEESLHLKSPSLNFEQAAAVPQAAMLAVQGLIDCGKIKNGQKILINGAGGGVGTFGAQIARQYDVELTGVDSTDKLETMLSVGFDHVIDYTREDFTKNGKSYDLILDNKTNRPLSHYARVLKQGGAYYTTGGDPFAVLKIFVLGSIISKLSSKKYGIVMLKPNKDLAYMNKLFEAGKVNPVIDGSFGLEDTPRAFDIFIKGAHKGKLVITIGNKQQDESP